MTEVIDGGALQVTKVEPKTSAEIEAERKEARRDFGYKSMSLIHACQAYGPTTAPLIKALGECADALKLLHKLYAVHSDTTKG